MNNNNETIKTTTKRILAAIMDPTEGNATIAGFDLRKQAEPIKHHIGYIVHQFVLYGDLTVRERGVQRRRGAGVAPSPQRPAAPDRAWPSG
jgi:ABC-type Na+ transport system ATPase subunit NatA